MRLKKVFFLQEPEENMCRDTTAYNALSNSIISKFQLIPLGDVITFKELISIEYLVKSLS